MTKILGLDLGTNSIGWAVVEEERERILGAGVRIFPEGVDNLGEGNNEMSKNAARNADRGARRQNFRRKLRRKLLVKLLQDSGMAPKEEPDFSEWKRLNPYLIREKADREKVSLHELGRIFFHISKRRGFQSNSRSALSSEDGAIFKGNLKEGKAGINDTLSLMNNRTLGTALAELLPEENEPFTFRRERIRNRYTTRQMYIDEFEAIWECQKQYHVELTEKLKAKIGGRKKDGYEVDGVVFYQRPLKSQKSLVGRCGFEEKKTKCPISRPIFEEFKIYQFINTVEFNNTRLDGEQRKQVADLLFRKEKVALKAIRKELGMLDDYYKFNYKDEDQISGAYTISKLSGKKFFGEEWFQFTPEKQDEIWHVIYFFDDIRKLQQYAGEKWGFSEESARQLARFHLKKGYASLSRKAISNILPFLKEGFQYDEAVVLGGVKNAFGKKWELLDSTKTQFIKDNVPEIIHSKTKGGFIANLKEYLASEFHLSEKSLNKLYHHSSNISASVLLPKLPVSKEADRELASLRNPVVVTALFELRKVVNELIERFGHFDKIQIELARDLKVPKGKRNEIRLEQQRLERENDKVRSELERLGKEANHINLTKYKLWLECQKTCPYTGESIGVHQLFNGEVEIEHILPWSRSLNDSFMNKTLCFRHTNNLKGDKTPFEYFSELDNWEQVKERALKLFSNSPEFPNRYRKFKQFVKTKLDEDFVSRQLNDTRYISREARSYLRKICENVSINTGQLTHHLRHYWGLNKVLFDDTKERTDHRHHAVDALVVACSKQRYLQEISRWNRYNKSYELKDFPKPWKTFWEDSKRAIDDILVSHRRSSKVITVKRTAIEKHGKVYINTGEAARGALHKEFVYGKRISPWKGEGYHVRKKLQDITTRTHVSKIVDPVVKKLVEERIESLGVDISGKYNVPKEAFFRSTDSGITPLIFLPNKNGEPVPVKKVRISENIGNAEKLKEINQYVNPRNNHHIAIYIGPNGELVEEAVTFWTAVERKKQGLPVIKPENEKGYKLYCSLKSNDMFLLNDTEPIDVDAHSQEELSRHLYRVQNISSNDYNFRLHYASKIDNKEELVRTKSLRAFMSYHPVKVSVSPSGLVAKC